MPLVSAASLYIKQLADDDDGSHVELKIENDGKFMTKIISKW